METWVFPTPLGPHRMTFSARSMKARVFSSLTTRRSSVGCASKSNESSVLSRQFVAKQSIEELQGREFPLSSPAQMLVECAERGA